MRILGWSLSILSAYALLCALAFLFQRRLIYFPVDWTETEARLGNPGYEELRIPTSDGEMLHAWLHREREAPWTVIVFHGNAGNLSFHEPAMAPFRALGLQVVLFDYRGYGLSSGSPTEAGLLRDGEAVVKNLEGEMGVPGDRMVYFGQSLGAGVATLLAARKPPARLILESAFDSIGAVARHHYPYLPVGPLLRDRYDAAAAIGRVSCPVLFLHPGEDEIIPVARGRALFARAKEPKRFVLLPGARHNDVFDLRMAEQVEAIREFLGLDPAPPR